MSGDTSQTALSLCVVSEVCAVHGHMTCRCADHRPGGNVDMILLYSVISENDQDPRIVPAIT